MSVRTKMTSQDRRAAIVRESVRLFSRHGFRGTTTREIANAVGVSEPVLYQHFATKNDLYSAIIDSKSREGQQKFLSVLTPFMETQDDEGFFRELAEQILAWYIDDPAYIRLILFSSLEGHELSRLCYERQAIVYFRFVSSYIERRIAQGAFREMDPLVAARAFAGMIGHYAMGRVIFPCDLLRDHSPSQVIHQMVEIFLSGIRKKARD